jgi:hypothetical protein
MVKVDSDYRNSPIIPGIQGGDLPEWANEPGNWRGYHAVVIYAYGSDHSSLKIFDPIDNSDLYGRWSVTSGTVYRGMQDDQNIMIW